MRNPFQNSKWTVELSMMGFQSLIYDEKGLLVCSVEPTDLSEGPSNPQVSRLIAAAPNMLRFVLALQENFPSPEGRKILSEVLGCDLYPQVGVNKL